jgi:carboxylesterase type B
MRDVKGGWLLRYMHANGLTTTLFGIILLGVATSELHNNPEEHTPIIVETNYGKVKGFFGEKSHANRNGDLYWFNSIPFAEPPVGNLRFEPPVPKKRWDGVLDVTNEGSPCVQGSDPVIGSEDCLFLKIQTGRKPNVHNNLPVLVWIYGGAFYLGSVDFDSHSPDFLINEDVIIVGVHYRVGLLGFLSTGDLVAPGNNGLRDQILALKWIKENIRYFGGDPDRITIWGQSAGAASVAYLLQANQTTGLFNQAILNSGSSLSAWALGKQSAAVVAKVAAKLDVDTASSTAILEGLRKIGTEELQSAAMSVMQSTLITSNPLQGLVYTPVIEPEHPDAVLSAKSHQMLKEGKFHHVPIMTGFNSLEGYVDSLPTLLRLWIGKYDVDNSLLVPEDMNAKSLATRLLGSNIKRRYFSLFPILLTSERLMRFIADTQMDKPILESINLYSAHTHVYAYHFSYIGPLYGRTERTIQAVGHTEELGYLFDFGIEGSDADYLTRNRMVKLWTNFCKYGNPTPKNDPLLNNVIWPANGQVSSIEDLKFLEVDTTLSVTGIPNQSNMLYWDNLYNKYGRPPYSTY